MIGEQEMEIDEEGSQIEKIVDKRNEDMVMESGNSLQLQNTFEWLEITHSFGQSPGKIYHSQFFTIDHKLFIIGGVAEGSNNSEITVFHTKTGEYEKCCRLNIKREKHSI